VDLTRLFSELQALCKYSAMLAFRDRLCIMAAMTKLTKAAAKRKFGSYYHIAKVLGLEPSSVTRWVRFVPEKYVPALEAHPGGVLEKGGKR
jgi:hypothetical protein